MRDIQNKRAQEGFTRTTEPLCPRDLQDTEDPGAVWGSSSTKGVSHPYWELWGLEGQCSLERTILASKMTNVRAGQES